jgi:sterol desaturase/sphingolipid hydroxylase (fatty acid hydroxylase superfamily)
VLELLLIFVVGPLFERLIGSRPNPDGMIVNLKQSLLMIAVSFGVMPTATVIGAIIISRIGGGLIVLPESGFGLLWAIPAFVLAMELADYLFHRVQHGWPPLWAMHSLHHSDTNLGITTSARVFWAEPLLRAVFIYPCVMLIFQPSAMTLAVYNIVLYWGYFDHLNIRLSFGPFRALLTSPIHRIHHAAEPALAGLNYAAVFPFIDLAFGTYRSTNRNEFPPSGLGAEVRQPRGFLDLVVWPFRSA